MYNRPLSPHITIYAAQISSLASIWHRISGILLTSSIVFYPTYIQLVICSSYNKYLFNFNILKNFWFFYYKIMVIIVLFSLFYHALNGLKQIMWDLGIFLSPKLLLLFFLIISSLICIIILLLIF
uniref:Succinate dehydrogenase subunit 3 n=1 Tax=Gracilaria ferox TaxID=1184158 RepID=A0A345UB66_9FLOR|nr:succinate dehydrogenase subunit 3 [Gracilaria ferox]AXI97702.1 succinate dehydrogenase subunit 3 [Gracilaria ferox]UAD89653.1 succinate dehydrogenase subunit 3 [Gracilaria ferox]